MCILYIYVWYVHDGPLRGVLVATGKQIYLQKCVSNYILYIYICMVNEIVRQCGDIFWVMLGGFHPNTYWGDLRLASLSFTQMTMSGLAGYFKHQFPTTNDTQMPRKAQGFQSHCNWESGLWIPASLAKSSSSRSLSIVPVQIFSSSGSGGMAKLSLEKWKSWKIAWFWMEFKTNLNAGAKSAMVLDVPTVRWWKRLWSSDGNVWPIQFGLGLFHYKRTSIEHVSVQVSPSGPDACNMVWSNTRNTIWYNLMKCHVTWLTWPDMTWHDVRWCDVCMCVYVCVCSWYMIHMCLFQRKTIAYLHAAACTSITMK